jgi:hypothetical protein
VAQREESGLNAKGYSTRDERRLLDALGCGLLKDFPNPERSGCPGPGVLQRIASRTMPLDEAGKWLDHLGSCSPCYADFSEFKRVRELRQRRTLLAIAASILVAASIGGWFLLQKHNEALVAQTAVVDLRDRSLPRGTQPNPDQPPLVVSRAARHWNIYLPLGSSEGSYEVRIVTEGGGLVMETTVEAKLESGIASLPVDLNLSLVRSARCNVEIRRNAGDWNSFPLLLR